MDQCYLRWNNKNHLKREYSYFKYNIRTSILIIDIYRTNQGYFVNSLNNISNYKYIRIRKEYSNKKVLLKIAEKEGLLNPYRKPFSRSKLKRYINCIEITKREYVKNK